MTTPASTAPDGEDAEQILDALLYSVSHDLRSPLLTLSLSAELIRESMGTAASGEAGGRTSVALDALKNGADDLERMLHALTTVSRARRRPLTPRVVALRMLLGGHIVISDAVDLERLRVPVDPEPFRDLLDRLCGDDPAEIQITRTDTHVVCRVPPRVELPPVDGSPLIALARSLQTHAGTVVEELAAMQVQLSRQSVTLAVGEGAVRVWLPLAAGAS